MITFRLIPGVVIVIRPGPRFPAATTTTSPSSQARSTPFTRAEFSLIPFLVQEPTEMFKIRIPSCSRCLSTQSIPASTSVTDPFPRRSKTLTAVSVHPGAIPW